jgi:hypothetical protein
MSNPYFKNFELNRDPRKPMATTAFKHGKGYSYNPKIAKSPEQLKEAKK